MREQLSPGGRLRPWGCLFESCAGGDAISWLGKLLTWVAAGKLDFGVGVRQYLWGGENSAVSCNKKELSGIQKGKWLDCRFPEWNSPTHRSIKIWMTAKAKSILTPSSMRPKSFTDVSYFNQYTNKNIWYNEPPGMISTSGEADNKTDRTGK